MTKPESTQAYKKQTTVIKAVEKISDINKATGRRVIVKSSGAGRAVRLAWDVIKVLPQIGRSYKTLFRQIDTSGFGSIMVLALIAGLTGMILALQTGSQLQNFGLLDSLGAIIGASFCREFGPIWAAIIILSRVGASMAAELGTMVVNEEVDALEIMSINPVRYLVLPRVIALIVVMPMLTVIADIVGIYGGAFVAEAQFGLPRAAFFESAQTLLGGWDFYSGLIKSMVFGAIIAIVACDQGLNTKGGAEGVGRATTQAVMLNVIFVLLTDFMMTKAMEDFRQAMNL